MSNDKYTIIELTRGFTAVIDNEDCDLISFKWRVIPKGGGRFYAARNKKNKGKSSIIQMHRVILGRMIGRELLLHEFVDHIDGNGLNNSRNNLRLADKYQNQQNQRKHIDSKNTSKGIWYNKKRNHWVARISCNGVRKHLGIFKNEEDATHAYREAALLYHGEFARFE